MMCRFLALASCLIALGLAQAATTRPTTRPVIHQAASKALVAQRVLTLGTVSAGFRRFDPSGIALDAKGRLVVVNDKWSVLQLVAFALPKSPGDVVLPLQQAVRGKARISFPRAKHWSHLRLRLDLEGLARCQGHWLVVSEQLRRVFRIHPSTGKTTQHPIAWQKYQRSSALRRRPVPRFSIVPNAGYEGIACNGKSLFLLQERQPRLVLVAKLPKLWREGEALKLVDHFDVPSPTLPRKIGRYTLSPDFAGAHAEARYLYVLSRNERRLLKIDFVRHRIVAAMSFAAAERKLYQRRKPYGLAEGVTMDATRIWIAFDNNGRARRGRPITAPDRRPVIVSFSRPTGF